VKKKSICPWGIAVMVLAFGLILAGCWNATGSIEPGMDNSALYGTWTKPADTGSNPDRFIFTPTGYTYDAGSIGTFTGTYAYNRPNIEIYVKTHSGFWATILVSTGKSRKGIITENSDGSITFTGFTTGLTLLNEEVWAQEGR
jgi:hypothetical protein